MQQEIKIPLVDIYNRPLTIYFFQGSNFEKILFKADYRLNTIIFLIYFLFNSFKTTYSDNCFQILLVFVILFWLDLNIIVNIQKEDRIMMSNKLTNNMPTVQSVKFVEKANGVIKGYSVNTYQGAVKDFNEDRVSIIMNITKPNFKGRWPKCSYFGVFDGHGGSSCANFLKDNLHKFITQNNYFPQQPIDALKLGFKKAECQFMRLAQNQVPIQRSGSCASVILIIDSICYIANVGDSRAILSSNRGTKIHALSNDHKPDAPSQRERIQKADGKIYQSSIKAKNGNIINGPFRINPGKLSVSRSFGDIEAKIEKYGGNPKVLIAKPQITYFEINHEQHDFIVVGSDGIFDKLTNQQIAECFWGRHQKRVKNSNKYIGEACSDILNQSMKHYSMDNITSLIIVFEDYGRLDLPLKNKQSSERMQSINSFSKKYHSNMDDGEKQNYTKMIVNGMRSDRGNSAKISQNSQLKRKSSVNFIDKSDLISSKALEKEKQLRNQSKIQKKERISKVSTSLKNDQKNTKNLKEQKESMIEKILKFKNLEKIR